MDIDTKMRDYQDVEMSSEDEELENPYTIVQDPDDNEEELEKQLFGHDHVQRKFSEIANKLGKPTISLDEEAVEDLQLTQNLQDDELFFIDAAPDAAKISQALQKSERESDSDDDITGEPAWRDSDDERVTISLASSNRLRKLRVTDEDDVMNGKEYSRRLRRQYIKLNPTPAWVFEAVSASSGDVMSEDESENEDSHSPAVLGGTEVLGQLLRDADAFKLSKSIGKRRKLAPEVINIQRMKNIASSGPSTISMLQTHTTLPFLLACGPSGSLDLYHLHLTSPDYYTKLASVVFKQMPLTTCSFHPLSSDSRIFVGARRRYFYVWNVSTGQIEKITRVFGVEKDEQQSMEKFKLSPTGKYLALLGSSRKGGGNVNILDAGTLQWVSQARIESQSGIADFAWWKDGTGLCIMGKNGMVTEWSLSGKRAIARWSDEGGRGATVLALGGKTNKAGLGGDGWIAIGSVSGVVNLYSRQTWLQESDQKFEENSFIPTNPKPVRAFEQLTTPTSSLSFSNDGQVLCMASLWKKDALRLVHVQSCTVYRNWPTSNTPLGRISAVTWGDIDGKARLFVGNEAGRVMCWEIHTD